MRERSGGGGADGGLSHRFPRRCEATLPPHASARPHARGTAARSGGRRQPRPREPTRDAPPPDGFSARTTPARRAILVRLSRGFSARRRRWPVARSPVGETARLGRLTLPFITGVAQMENPLIGRRVHEEGDRFEGTIAAVGIDQAQGHPPSSGGRSWSSRTVASSASSRPTARRSSAGSGPRCEAVPGPARACPRRGPEETGRGGAARGARFRASVRPGGASPGLVIL
jgi:hypothetical protein